MESLSSLSRSRLAVERDGLPRAGVFRSEQMITLRISIFFDRG